MTIHCDVVRCLNNEDYVCKLECIHITNTASCLNNEPLTDAEVHSKLLERVRAT